MKHIFFLLTILGLMSAAVMAQDPPKVEVFGGYSYFRAGGEGEPGTNLNGWHASVAGNFNKVFGVAAEVSGHYGKEDVTVPGAPPVTVRGDFSAHTFLVGPRFSYRNNDRVTPFAHVLLGGTRAKATGSVGSISASESDTAFTAAVGGGLDVKLTQNVALRLIQADYVLTRFANDSQSNARVSVGLVFRFGQK